MSKSQVTVCLLFLIVFGSGCAPPDAEKEMSREFTAIMKIGDHPARREKLVAFAGKSPKHQEYMQRALKAEINQANEALETRCDIMQALAMAGSPLAGAAILNVARDDRADAARNMAAAALGRKWSRVDINEFPIEEYVDIIRGKGIGAGELTAIVRWTAVESIGRIYGHRQINFLAAMLEDDDWSVRSVVISAIQKCGKPEDLQTVLQQIDKWHARQSGEVDRICLTLRKITGQMPPNADPNNSGGDDELKWWLSKLKVKE